MSHNKMNWEQIQSLSDIDRTIHEPARLMLVAILSAVGSADFVYLMHQTGLTRGNLSCHMSKLEEAEYIAVEKRFVNRIPQTLLRLTGRGHEAFAEYRGKMRVFLAE